MALSGAIAQTTFTLNHWFIKKIKLQQPTVLWLMFNHSVFWSIVQCDPGEDSLTKPAQKVLMGMQTTQFFIVTEF